MASIMQVPYQFHQQYQTAYMDSDIKIPKVLEPNVQVQPPCCFDMYIQRNQNACCRYYNHIIQNPNHKWFQHKKNDSDSKPKIEINSKRIMKIWKS